MTRTADKLTSAAATILRERPGLDPSRAYQIALDENPELAAAHHAGDADRAAVRDAPAAEPGLDPGAVLLAAAAAFENAGYGPERARLAAHEALPVASRAWSEGRRLVAPAAAPTADPPMRHYSTLSRAEQERALPGLRRLADGEPQRPGRTYLAKMGAPGAGGGMFEVMP